MELKKLLVHCLIILTFFEVICALIETAVRLGFTHWTNSKALLVLK